MKKTWMLMLSSILAIFVLGACGNGDKPENEGAAENEQQEANGEVQEPNLEGIPDVVAEVNDKEITKEDFVMMYQQQFQGAMMQAQLSGEELDQDELKKQTAEGMVGQELLIQEANKRIPEVADEEVNAMVDQLVEQNGMETKEELLAVFAEQGVDENDFMDLVEVEIKVKQIVAEEAGDMEPSEEEIKETYEMMEAQQEGMESDEETPSFDEMKPVIKEQLKQQKEAEATQALASKLRENADVTIHL